jgi:hypothetical protein
VGERRDFISKLQLVEIILVYIKKKHNWLYFLEFAHSISTYIPVVDLDHVEMEGSLYSTLPQLATDKSFQ